MSSATGTVKWFNADKGYGFIDTDIEISSIEDVEAFITPQKHTIETESILTQYFLKQTTSTVLDA